MASLLTIDNQVFRSFLGYATLVLVKTLAMSAITSFHRLANKAFTNPEDAAGFGAKQTVSSPAVERVRRAHLNDLENVIPFVLLGLLYISTGPSNWAATLHFRIFTISRFIHTIAYLFAIPQPTRALAFYAGFAVNASLAYNIFKQATF